MSNDWQNYTSGTTCRPRTPDLQLPIWHHYFTLWSNRMNFPITSRDWTLHTHFRLQSEVVLIFEEKSLKGRKKTYLVCLKPSTKIKALLLLGCSRGPNCESYSKKCIAFVDSEPNGRGHSRSNQNFPAFRSPCSASSAAPHSGGSWPWAAAVFWLPMQWGRSSPPWTPARWLVRRRGPTTRNSAGDTQTSGGRCVSASWCTFKNTKS